MADTVRRVERKVGKALASFQKARDALATAEADARAESAALGVQAEDTQNDLQEQIAELTRQAEERVRSLKAYQDQLNQTGDNAASIRAKLDEFLTP